MLQGSIRVYFCTLSYTSKMFRTRHFTYLNFKKSNAILVTGRRGVWGCEMSSLSRILDNRLIDGGELALRFGALYPPHPQSGGFLVLTLLEAESTPEP
jgi:hypothetical protein